MPLTLAELRAALPPYDDVEVEGLGTFRLHRLDTLEVLRHQMLFGLIPEGDEPEAQDANVRHSMSFVAKCLGGDYDSDDGRALLMQIGLDPQTELINRAGSLNRLNVAQRTKDLEEAKNE